jgi:hypothetical protein
MVNEKTNFINHFRAYAQVRQASFASAFAGRIFVLNLSPARPAAAARKIFRSLAGLSPARCRFYAFING